MKKNNTMMSKMNKMMKSVTTSVKTSKIFKTFYNWFIKFAKIMHMKPKILSVILGLIAVILLSLGLGVSKKEGYTSIEEANAERGRIEQEMFDAIDSVITTPADNEEFRTKLANYLDTKMSYLTQGDITINENDVNGDGNIYKLRDDLFNASGNTLPQYVDNTPRNINARYIRVQNRGLPQLTDPTAGGNWLQIQELEVWGYEKGDSGNLVNLAYKGREGGAGSIEVKSEWHQAKRHKAVNGNISNFNGVYHSIGVGEDEFWQLDLGDSYHIKKIVHYNRHDCCQNRAANMTINIYNTKPNNSDLNKVGGLIPQIILTSDIQPQEFDLDQYISDFENAGKIKSYNGKSCLSGETDDSITMKTCDDNDIKQRWNTSYTSINEKREYIIYNGVTNDKCITNDTDAIKLTNDCGSGINTSKWLIYPSDLPLLKEKINDLAREANELIKIIIPKGDGYKAAMDMNVTRLLTKNTELQQQHAKLLEKLKEPMKLDENFELSKLTTTSNFSYYMLYLIFTIFIVGCLIFVFKNPEESNLDMFILALAGMIFAYYVYDYYKKRKRN